jgi:hypothetical protein
MLARALRFIGAAVALALGVVAVFYAGGSLSPSQVHWKDFGQEYLLARAIRDGADPYVPVSTLAERYAAPIGFMDKPHPTPHPPTVGIILLPVAWLSYPVAATTWFVVELACLMAAVQLLAVANQVPLRARMVPLVALMLAAWPAIVLELGLGQLTIPILALLAGAQLALERSRPKLAGALIGMSLLLKPLAWPVVIVLALYRDWRAALAAAATTFAGYLVAGAVIGFDRLVRYMTVVLPEVSASMLFEPTNTSLWAVAPRVVGSTSSLGAGLLPLLAALTLFGWILVRRPRRSVAVGAATAASAVLSPIAWQFYVVLGAQSVLDLGNAVARRGFRRMELIAAFGVGVLLIMSWHLWLLISTVATQWLPSRFAELVLFGPALAIVLLILLVGVLTDRRRT